MDGRLQLLASGRNVILAFTAHGLEQLVFNLFAFGAIDFDVLAPLRHVVLVVAGLGIAKFQRQAEWIHENLAGDYMRRRIHGDSKRLTIRRAMRGMSHELPVNKQRDKRMSELDTRLVNIPNASNTQRIGDVRCFSSSLPEKTLSLPGTVNLSSKSVRL